MKLKNFLSFLSAIVIILVSGNVGAVEQCTAKIIDGLTEGADYDVLNPKPIPFVPFTNTEVTSFLKSADQSQLKVRLQVDDSIAVDVKIVFTDESDLDPKNHKVVTETIDAFVKNLNDLESKINTYGLSIRTSDISLTEATRIWSRYTDPKLLRDQLLKDLKTRVTTQLQACVDAIPVDNCPQLALSEVTQKVTSPLGGPLIGVSATDKLRLPTGQQMTVGQFVNASNNTAKVMCSLGYNFYEKVGFSISGSPPSVGVSLPSGLGLNDFVVRISGTISTWLPTVGIDLTELSNPFNLSGFDSLKDYSNIDLDMATFTGKFSLPTPEWIKNSANSTNLPLPSNLKIPEIPNIPAVVPPQHPELNLTKRKDWPGFNVGNVDLVAATANAYYAIYGSEKAQAAVAFGKFTTTIVTNEINIVSGSGDFFAGETSKAKVLSSTVDAGDLTNAAYAKLNFKFLKFDYTYNASVSVDPIVLKKQTIDIASFKEGYSQKFMIGIVPVEVAIGGEFVAKIDLNAGIGLMRLYGTVEPKVVGSGYAQGGVTAGIVSAGAGATLVIINAAVPLEGVAELKFAERGEPYLDLTLNADAKIRTLDGNVYGYAEYYVPRWGMPPWKKERATKTLFEWQGTQISKNIINWGMTLGYHGVKIKGDLVDQADLTESKKLDEAILLAQKRVEVAAYALSANNRLAAVFTGINGDFDSETQRSVNVVTGATTLTQTRKYLDDEVIANLNMTLLGLDAEDSDGDGLKDIEEVKTYKTDPLKSDSDSDGLTDLKEVQLGTKPTIADTDGDGLSDGTEVTLGLNPINADTDFDGLSDGQEISLGTKPLVTDSDGDGIPDGYEVRNGLNPKDSTDANLDKDGDGYSNIAEYKGGSEANNVAITPETVKKAAVMITIIRMLLD